MSKHIDAERLNMEWQTLKPFGVTDTMIENLKWIVDSQPTIEVSEDCISSEWLLNFFVEFPDDYTLTIGNLRAVIEDAPSVVPSRAEGEVISNECMG